MTDLSKLTMTVTVTGDFIAHEVMRFGLKEIVRLREEDPFAYSAEDAADLAQVVLDKVEELEDGT